MRKSAAARHLLCVMGMALLCTGSTAAPEISPKLQAVDDSLMPSAAEIQSWLDKKDAWGPAYTGGPGWKHFMGLLHDQLKATGLVKVTDYAFPYTRWYTSEYPDKSGWSLMSDGGAVDVASYGTQSGSTGPGGITAPMILYDLTLPVERRPALAALAGKIVVVRQQPYSSFGTPARVPLGVPAPAAASAFCGNPPLCKPQAAGDERPSPQWGKPGPMMGYKDYEYRSDDESFPSPLSGKTPVAAEASYRNRDQFGQIRDVITHVLMPSKAAGAVTVMDMSPLASAGARIHPTPRQFDVPLLMLDRVAGAKVLADAQAGKTATLVLDAHEEDHATAYETVATLPGRDYGTPENQSILLATHVDGPSVIEDDGAFGILSVLRYYAHIPQSERPKSIIVYLESRHFVPGTEAGYPFELVRDRKDLFKSVVGGLALEHFGGQQYGETGNVYAPTGKAATTYVWGWPNPLAVAEATRAIKDQALPRAINDVPARPGVNGKAQATWMGGGFSRYLVDLGGWPGWHVSGDWPSAGFQAYYPAAKTRVSADLFRKQAKLAVQLTNVLMTGDVIALAPAWGYLQTDIATLEDSDFAKSDDARAGRALLTKDFDRVFDAVKAGRYADVRARLPAIHDDAARVLAQKPAAMLDSAVLVASAMAQHGVAWQARKSETPIRN